ncbi:beta-lactamase/transpeptidase-like protein [Ilyonectria sp. MPI-CAGE-AT-0026]|nr:beta-lactamase/transpeptidase-like protein [Ilyonectria sp. MPI-CAGE-AT-0026]
MATVYGHCDPKFNAVRDLLQGFVNYGEEIGTAIFVNVDDEDVVDLHGGYTDENRRIPWTKDTIVNVYSTTKMVASLAVLMLVDWKILSISDKVVQHLPEFGSNGKEDVEVRHLLNHTSGLAGWEDPVAFDDIMDGQGASKRLADQAPWWTPGAASGHHSLTFGHLLGALFESSSTINLGESNASSESSHIRSKVFSLVPEPALVNSPANGHGNARALTRLMSTIALAGREGALPCGTVDQIFQEQARGVDLVIDQSLRWGVGFGGSMVIMDLDRKVTISYVMNRLTDLGPGNKVARQYATAMYGALGAYLS